MATLKGGSKMSSEDDKKEEVSHKHCTEIFVEYNERKVDIKEKMLDFLIRFFVEFFYVICVLVAITCIYEGCVGHSSDRWFHFFVASIFLNFTFCRLRIS